MSANNYTSPNADDTTNELRQAILTEFKQVHKLAPADYTENCTNVVMSLIAAERQRWVKDELEDRLRAIEGLGSKGDKVHGDPKFMQGIEAVEEHLKHRIAALDGERGKEQ